MLAALVLATVLTASKDPSTLALATDPGGHLLLDSKPRGEYLALRRVAERRTLSWISFAAVGDTIRVPALAVTLKDGRRLVPVEWFVVGPGPRLVALDPKLAWPAAETERQRFKGRVASVVFGGFKEAVRPIDVLRVETENP